MTGVMITNVASLLSYIFPPSEGEDSEHQLNLIAVPGLITILDTALLRSVEGQLTSTICTSHGLLGACLQLKQQAKIVLAELSTFRGDSHRQSLVESFARSAIECSNDATDRLSTDGLARTANISDPNDSSTAGSSSHVLSGVGFQGIASGVLESKEDTGRRYPSEQKRRDCWESPRVFCPDHVWADDVFLACQRLIRNLFKHPFYISDIEALVGTGANQEKTQPLPPEIEREVALLLHIGKDDIPYRMQQFRTAIDSESVVLKRLYLVKCEYRAPFRAFLEAHQSVQRAPAIELVDEYIAMKSDEQKHEKTQKLQQLLESPELAEALTLEQQCEELEIEMARALYPFTELARMFDHRRARLRAVPHISEDHGYIIVLEDYLRRLKCLLCRKAGPETSTGIRPLILDIHGMPRDDVESTPRGLAFSRNSEAGISRRLDDLLHALGTLGKLCKSRNAFHTEKRVDFDLPAAIVKTCTEFDAELFRCRFLDYSSLVMQQMTLVGSSSFEALGDQIRLAEMETSVAVASRQSLQLVRQRLDVIAKDRSKRFDVLKQMTEEVCLREMNLHIFLKPPEKSHTLVLKETSALGMLGMPLVLAGESLPIG